MTRRPPKAGSIRRRAGFRTDGVLLFNPAVFLATAAPGWPAPGSEDTKFGVTMGPEVGHGASEVHAGVQA